MASLIITEKFFPVLYHVFSLTQSCNTHCDYVYVDQIVHQGCSTSPCAFNLVMKTIAEGMCELTSGLTCNGKLISLIFYADDILIISMNEEEALEAINLLTELCRSVGLQISREKSKIVSASINDTLGEQDSLEMVLHQKYLGVFLQIGIQTAFLESKVNTAEKYARSCMSLASSSPDPVLFASIIWSNVAVPTILYGTEAVLLTMSEIRKIESIQHSVARYVLQIGEKSASPSTYLLGGFRPFFCVYWERVLKYYATIMTYDESKLARNALEENKRMGPGNPYVKMVDEIWTAIGWDGNKESIRDFVDAYSVKFINDERIRCYSSCRLLRKSDMGHVTQKSRMPFMSDVRKAYHNFILYDAGLGNRTPIPGFESIKQCILCINDGDVNELKEDHMLFECPPMESIREKYGINIMVSDKGWEHLSADDKYKAYWTEDMGLIELERRTNLASNVKKVYMDAAHTLLRRKEVLERLNYHFQKADLHD